MSTPANHQSAMVLFSHSNCINCHRVRLVLAEKGITADIVEPPPGAMPDELMLVNPTGSLPTLIDRDLGLYNAKVINDYLDERYPHPPLLPVDPVSRARTRLALHRIEADWYALVPALSGTDTSLREKAASQLSESLTASASVFEAMPFFLSEEYSILDATLAPLLWRMPQYGIVLDSGADSVNAYATRMFSRDGFQTSLSVTEKALRNA